MYYFTVLFYIFSFVPKQKLYYIYEMHILWVDSYTKKFRQGKEGEKFENYNDLLDIYGNIRQRGEWNRAVRCWEHSRNHTNSFINRTVGHQKQPTEVQEYLA